jgi:hypothetical protein
MTNQVTHLHIETLGAGWLKATWRRGADAPENTVFCRFRLPRNKREDWLLIGLQASKHSRPPWLSSALLDDVPRYRVELAVHASKVFQDGLRDPLEVELTTDLDELSKRVYRQAPLPKLERRPRNRLDDEFYRQVAASYRQAVAAGLPPSKTLAEIADTPPGTVNRWIAEARKRGFLPRAERGKVST